MQCFTHKKDFEAMTKIKREQNQSWTQFCEKNIWLTQNFQPVL